MPSAIMVQEIDVGTLTEISSSVTTPPISGSLAAKAGVELHKKKAAAAAKHVKLRTMGPNCLLSPTLLPPFISKTALTR
ncbi:hypothetical protein I4000191A8_19200 [Clostridia bacterium i40-0019-1A8]